MHADHEPARSGGVSPAGHAAWFRDRLSRAHILDVGASEHTSRAWRARGLRGARRPAVAGLVLLSLGCAVSGALLALAPADVTASMTADTYRLGSAVLHARAPGQYVGDGVLMVIREKGGVRAGGSAIVGGAPWTGVCEVAPGGGQETCSFREGGTMLAAHDTWTDGRWRRVYSDGRRVSINVDRGVPVPFPVGR